MTRFSSGWVGGCLATATLAAVALAGCGSGPQPTAVVAAPTAGATAAAVATPAPSAAGGATASPAPTTAATPRLRVFTSERHGYRVEVPPGWAANEYEGTWTSLDQFSPGAEVPGEDAIAPRTSGAFLVANAMPIPPGMTAAEWQAAFDARVAAGIDADCPLVTSSGTLAGEPATIGEQACGGSILVGRSLTHGDRGYYFTIRYPADDAATRAILEQVVASIQFTGN